VALVVSPSLLDAPLRGRSHWEGMGGQPRTCDLCAQDEETISAGWRGLSLAGSLEAAATDELDGQAASWLAVSEQDPVSGVACCLRTRAASRPWIDRSKQARRLCTDNFALTLDLSFVLAPP
jgi:hypothetical protein